MPHDPRAAVFDMIQAVERAQRLSSGLSEEDFISNEPVHWAVYSQIACFRRLTSTFRGQASLECATGLYTDTTVWIGSASERPSGMTCRLCCSN